MRAENQVVMEFLSQKAFLVCIRKPSHCLLAVTMCAKRTSTPFEITFPIFMFRVLIPENQSARKVEDRKK